MRYLSILLLLVVASCGGSPTEAACQSFLDDYQALPCTGGLDLGVDCAQYRDYPCDRTEYFTCLKDQYFCDDNGDYVDLGEGACAALQTCS